MTERGLERYHNHHESKTSLRESRNENEGGDGMKLRKVEVTDWKTGETKDALFHKFGFESDDDSGFNVAIVENKDGTVETIRLQYIRFLDALKENNDDVEIIIDPTPEQIPDGWMWCAHWDDEDDLNGNLS